MRTTTTQKTIGREPLSVDLVRQGDLLLGGLVAGNIQGLLIYCNFYFVWFFISATRITDPFLLLLYALVRDMTILTVGWIHA